MSNDFLNELLALHPELAEEYESEQYKLSLKIIGLMTELGVESKKMAKIIGCSHNKYLRLESGDVSVPVCEYKEAIFKIKVYKEQNSASDEQTSTSDEQLNMYGEFSFSKRKALRVSTLESITKMQCNIRYSKSESTHTTERAIPLLYIKSYRHNFKGLHEVIEKTWSSLALKNTTSTSSRDKEYTYNY